MTHEETDAVLPPWQATLRQFVTGLPPSAACAVILPIYRPDVAEAMAATLGAVFYDFRRDRLAPLGWEASKVPLAALIEAAEEKMADGRDVVLQNAEALMALHPAQARRGWFVEAFGRVWPRRLILPVVLYAADLPDMAARTLTFTADDLPEERLFDRMSGLR